MGMPREAVTIRFPKEVLDDARRARPKDQSFNEFVVEVVAREARLRRGREALKRIDALREQIFRRTGLQPDSTELIRETREQRAGRFD